MPFFADNKLASFMRCKRGHCELVFSCVVKLYLLGTNGAPSKTSQRKWTTIYNLQRIHLLFAVLCISTTVLQKFHQNSPASRHRKFFLYYYTLYSFANFSWLGWIPVWNKFGSQNSINCFVFSFVNISDRSPWTRLFFIFIYFLINLSIKI